jgi:hypothetical protein
MNLKNKFALTAILLLAGSLLLFACHGSLCGKVCGIKPNSDIKSSAACGSCGKNSCDKNCTAGITTVSTEDSSQLKALVPSCNLSGTEMSARKQFLLASMSKKIVKTNELETGYDMVFEEPIEYSKELLDFVNFERQCCTSFTFALVFEPNSKATHLQMYGSKAIKEELRNGLKEVGFSK